MVLVANCLFNIHSFIFWHAPLGVCSTKCRHQSPEWTILSHVDCFIQGEVVGFQVLLDSLHPCSMRASWWSPPVLQGGSCWDLYMLYKDIFDFFSHILVISPCLYLTVAVCWLLKNKQNVWEYVAVEVEKYTTNVSGYSRIVTYHTVLTST